MNPMPSKRTPKVIFSFLITALILFPGYTFAQYQYEFIPSISVAEQYDDNVYLNNTNKKSDYMTSISPSAEFWVRSEKKNLSLRYTPSFVKYAEESQNDTIRHSGALTYLQDITEHIQFNLRDIFLRSEQPIEETEDVQGIRRTRNTYIRNNVVTSLSYVFGSENRLEGGYNHSLLKNEDVTIDDSVIQNPYARLTYWFDVQNGFECNYRFTRADFWRDDDSNSGDDYRGHSLGIKYKRRFRPHTIGVFGYDYTTRRFEGDSEDYNIHEGSIGLDHAFSEFLTLSARTGYFIQKNERSDNSSGFTYNFSLSKRFKRGNWSIGGRGGWNEAYQEAERRGFTRFWSALGNVEYQLLESISGYGGASYREDTEEEPDRSWTTLRSNLGIKWAFWKYFAVSLDYTYADRDDDVDTEDYTVNRIMLMLSGSRLFKW